jgi:uncharacterized protein
MEKTILALSDLQEIDRKLDEIIDLRGNLPQEIEEYEAELAEIREKRDRFQEKHDELKSSLNKLNEEITHNQSELKHDEENLFKVKNNKEYDALTKQISNRKTIVENNQAEITEKDEKLKLVDEHLKSYSDKFNEIEKIVNDLTNDLESKIAETKSDEEKLVKKRNKPSKVLGKYLHEYENIRRSKRDTVVTMHKKACSGCFSVLPLQRQAEIRRKNKIVNCEACGRIVVAGTDEEEK